MRKRYLLAELLILKHRQQNISVSNTALLTAVACSEVTCCENPFDVLTNGDGVGCCEQSGAYRLVLYWSRYKDEWPVLSRCLASLTASASHLLPVWQLIYFSTGQRSCPQGTQDRAAINWWNIRLHRSNSVASQQSWPEHGRLPDVGKHCSRIHDVDPWSHV